MAEYIEKNVAIARLTALEIGNPCSTMADAKRQIADTRPADVAPVVHGRWVTHYRSGTPVAEGYVSTCCDMWNKRKSDYCPNCGSKMDGGDSDEAD